MSFVGRIAGDGMVFTADEVRVNMWGASETVGRRNPTFVFRKCCICRRLNVKMDGINYQYLDGCFHNSHMNEYNIQ